MNFLSGTASHGMTIALFLILSIILHIWGMFWLLNYQGSSREDKEFTAKIRFSAPQAPAPLNNIKSNNRLKVARPQLSRKKLNIFDTQTKILKKLSFSSKKLNTIVPNTDNPFPQERLFPDAPSNNLVEIGALTSTPTDNADPEKNSESLDNGQKINDYNDILNKNVTSVWIIPQHLSANDGGAMVAIAIDSVGNVKELRLEQSSGNKWFDASVLKAIEDASPFPRPPADLIANYHYRATFRFNAY